MGKDGDQTREPLVIGELVSGLEALAVLGLPAFCLVFCVIHTVQVQEMIRQVRTIAPTEIDVWEVILDGWLLTFSLVLSSGVTAVFLVVTALGVITWRLVASGVGILSTRRRSRHYAALGGANVMEADAWSRDLPEPETELEPDEDPAPGDPRVATPTDPT